jgi:hypothetical protein
VRTRPKCRPQLLALSERLRDYAKAAHGDQRFATDLINSAFAVRRLACIAVMLDDKIDVNPQQKERIERELITLWRTCI